MAGSTRKDTLARRVWRLMFDLLMQTSPDRAQALADRGLSPNDARTLSSLDPAKGRSMRSLADEWGCDASNATWIVDRVEKMGLAERHTAPGDRRVKLVVLTRKGEALRSELMEEFYRPPAEVMKLDKARLEALEQILHKMMAVADTKP